MKNHIHQKMKKTNKQDTWEILVTLVDTLSNTSKSLCPGAQIPYIKNPYNDLDNVPV